MDTADSTHVHIIYFSHIQEISQVVKAAVAFVPAALVQYVPWQLVTFLCTHEISIIIIIVCIYPIQEIPEDFDIKSHVLRLLEESGRSDLRPKNMDIDAFLQ